MRLVVRFTNSCAAGALRMVRPYLKRARSGQAAGAFSIATQERVCREHLDRTFGSGNYIISVFSDEETARADMKGASYIANHD